MPSTTRDPWVDVRTLHGFAADQVISALQKEIRRGHTENAVLLAYEMARTSPALEDYLWQRLLVIAVEDIGFGELQAPVLVHALHQTVQTFDRSVGERVLFAVHAVRYLCGCPKAHRRRPGTRPRRAPFLDGRRATGPRIRPARYDVSATSLATARSGRI